MRELRQPAFDFVYGAFPGVFDLPLHDFSKRPDGQFRLFREQRKMTLVLRYPQAQCPDAVFHSLIEPYTARNCKPHMATAIHQNDWMGKPQLRQTLARNLRTLMGRNPDLDSQPKLAKRSGVSQTHVSRILRGETSASADQMEKLAAALGVQPWELLTDSDETRRSAIERLLSGPRADDAKVAQHLPPAPRARRSR